MQGEARLWSVNRLAGELDMDRRTLGKRLRHVPPDGQLRGHAAWHLATVLRALDRDPVAERSGAPRRKQRQMPECLVPFGGKMTSGGNPVAEGMATALLGVTQDFPCQVAAVAVGIGVPVKMAYALFHAVGAVLARHADREMEKCGLAWSRPDVFDPPLFPPLEPDWEVLARMAGEKVDITAWQEYVESVFGDGGEPTER